MDYNSIILILNLIKEGIGVVKELSDLADRILRGETISDEEIKMARIAVKEAADRWRKSQ